MLQGLPKTGVNRYFPRDVVLGPRERHGLGYNHPYYLQIIKQASIVMKHWGKPSITGDGGGLLQVEWEGLIQCAGLAGSP